MMRKKPVGKVKPAIKVASMGFEARRPGIPPRIERSKRAPMEMNMPPRKDLRTRSAQLSLALTIVDLVIRRPISKGVRPCRESIAQMMMQAIWDNRS